MMRQSVKTPPPRRVQQKNPQGGLQMFSFEWHFEAFLRHIRK